MRLAVFLLLAGLCTLSHTQVRDPFFWLLALRSRGYTYGSLQADTTGGDCPSVCDCPPSFPVAMYCDNRGLKDVPYVPSRMKYVYLQHNHISSINDGAFDNATHLVWVMLHRNQLVSDHIGKEVFSKLTSLERLYLDHNNLTQVPSNLPNSIRDLRLNNNHITKLQPSSFEGMANLTILHLHDNTIQNVGAALKSLTSLTLLDLSRNELKKVPESLPEMLHQLYMEFNHIDSIPDDFFSKFTQLQFMRISHNELTDSGIPPNVFNVSGLVELDLSFNKLEKIPPVSTSLEHLYLQANQIKEFSLSSFCGVVDIVNFSHLKVLRLGGNRISMSDLPSEAALCLRLASTLEV